MTCWLKSCHGMLHCEYSDLRRNCPSWSSLYSISSRFITLALPYDGSPNQMFVLEFNLEDISPRPDTLTASSFKLSKDIKQHVLLNDEFVNDKMIDKKVMKELKTTEKTLADNITKFEVN
eukprot:839683_1